MQETPTHTPDIIAPHHGTWYASIIFFILSIVASAGLYAMIYLNSSSIKTLQSDIERIQGKIDSASTDRNIVVANIIRENTIRPSLDLKKIVADFRVAAARAGVEFDGFSIKDDVISTKLTSLQGNKSHPDAVATIIDMMNTYNTSKQSFKLGDIKSVSGNDARRTTTIELHVLPTITQ